ncbi:phage tail assembly protein [Paenibacillus sp. PR3]|uniref:Phage tail assembly protein n=2 Tax=Paenibacillus terricola TaxID=2763503 RepID=A0ABR8N2Q6_9BACL|nr:phage tail assembly protein [Paenibacillus terricola]MBD3922436.1 phage tail assembly protein [Paenibacillus terricola]
MSFMTEYEFTLPRGYVDKHGNLHKHGTMRLATAADEILPLRDPRVQQNAAYLTIILLSRVITKLGDLPVINPGVIEGLFSSDLAYLQQLYARINEGEGSDIDAECPQCEHRFKARVLVSGEV